MGGNSLSPVVQLRFSKDKMTEARSSANILIFHEGNTAGASKEPPSQLYHRVRAAVPGSEPSTATLVRLLLMKRHHLQNLVVSSQLDSEKALKRAKCLVCYRVWISRMFDLL